MTLEEKAKWVRQQIIEMSAVSGHGHLGGSLSCVEILLTLYDKVMLPNDMFILSKGHAAQALYAVLALKGYFSAEELQTFCQRRSRLEGHPTLNVPGVHVAAGSLGNGLGIACGMAYAWQTEGIMDTIYVLMGDGECYEGAIWEAAMFASHHKLSNIVVIIDRNFQCVLDYTESNLKLEPLAKKWDAFGWIVQQVNGHNPEVLGNIIKHYKPLANGAKPLCVIANTIKGKGASFMEGKLGYHGSQLTPEQLTQARQELG